MFSSHRTLDVYLFGSPKVIREGTALNVPRTQTRALLYLLAARLEPVPRARLVYLLWPDVSDVVAGRRLTNALNHLRRALGVPAALLKQGDTVQLNPDLVWSDANAFVRSVANDRKDGESAPLRALDLYQGTFLQDISTPDSAEYENWMVTERALLERLFLSALRDHIVQASHAGLLADAIAGGERYLAVDELSEETYRQLIQDYGRLGDRGAVQRTYERCESVLAEELDVEPLPSTLAAYKAALASTEVAIQQNGTITAQEHSTVFQLPLVGRTNELATLREAHQQVHAGAGRCVMLAGESGIGKSRLVKEFLAMVNGQVHVLFGACVPGHQLPYQSLVEALRTTFEAGHLPQGMDSAGLGEAARLLPELHLWFDGLAKTHVFEAAHSRMRLYQSLEQIVQGYAVAERTVALVLEDIQWADSALLEWLAYLAPRLQKHRLLILGTYNETATPQLRQLQKTLEHCGVLLHCHLERLAPVPIHHLLQGIPMEGTDDTDLASRLYQLSGGNPNYLWEIMRAVQEIGRPLNAVMEAEPTWLSNSLHGVIEKRIEQVDPLGRQILQAAAVCGESFDFDLVMHVAGRSEAESITALDALVNRQLVLESSEVYRFQHEIVRNVVYRSLSSGRRRLLHRRIALFLEERYNYQTQWEQHPPGRHSASATLSHRAPPALVAHHFQEAGEPGRSAQYLLAAGRNAFGSLAFTEAAHYGQDGLQMLAEVPSSPARERLEVQLLTLLGNAIATTHGTAAPEAAEAFERARRLLQQMGEVAGLFPVLAGLAISFFTRADLKATDELCAKLEVLAESEPLDVNLLMSLTLRGLVSYFQGHLAKALQCFEKAHRIYDIDRHLHLSRIYGYDPGLFGLCYSAAIHILCGRSGVGIACLESAMSLAEQIAQPYLKNSIHYYQAICYHHLRQVEQARQQAEIVLANAQEQAYPAQMVLALLLQGWARVMQGEGVLGLNEMQYALSILDKAGAVIGHPLYLSILAEGYVSVGQYEDARLTLKEALTLVQKRDERFWLPELERLYGEVLVVGNSELQDADMWFRRAIASAHAIGATSLALRAASSHARLLLLKDEQQQASDLLLRHLQDFPPNTGSADVLEAQRLLATVHKAQ